MTEVAEALLEARIDQLKEESRTSFNAGDAETAKSELYQKTFEGAPVGFSLIASTVDGEIRTIPNTMLKLALKKRVDGKPAFRTLDPDTKEWTGPFPEHITGKTPCWFNPKSEQYAAIQDISGLAGFQCASEQLASAFDAEQHVRNRHSRRYQVAKDAMARKEREDDRAIQKASVDAMLKLAGQRSEATVPLEMPSIFHCTVEGCSRFFDSAEGRKIHESKPH